MLFLPARVCRTVLQIFSAGNYRKSIVARQFRPQAPLVLFKQEIPVRSNKANWRTYVKEIQHSKEPNTVLSNFASSSCVCSCSTFHISLGRSCSKLKIYGTVHFLHDIKRQTLTMLHGGKIPATLHVSWQTVLWLQHVHGERNKPHAHTQEWKMVEKDCCCEQCHFFLLLIPSCICNPAKQQAVRRSVSRVPTWGDSNPRETPGARRWNCCQIFRVAAEITSCGKFCLAKRAFFSVQWWKNCCQIFRVAAEITSCGKFCLAKRAFFSVQWWKLGCWWINKGNQIRDGGGGGHRRAVRGTGLNSLLCQFLFSFALLAQKTRIIVKEDGLPNVPSAWMTGQGKAI